MHVVTAVLVMIPCRFARCACYAIYKMTVDPDKFWIFEHFMMPFCTSQSQHALRVFSNIKRMIPFKDWEFKKFGI